MNTITYHVQHHPHGRVIHGPICVRDFCVLADEWSKQGFNRLDALIAQRLQATFVATSKAGSLAWREELGIAAPDDDQAQ